MTVRATTPADYPAMVALWNTQAARIRLDMRVVDWTVDSCAAFIAQSFAHRIDDANGSFAILTLDPETGEYELLGGISATLGLGRSTKALAGLLPPGATIRGDVGKSMSQTIRTYFNNRYTPEDKITYTRYRSTALNMVTKA